MGNSRIYNSIKKCNSNGSLEEPFRVSNVNNSCNGILKKSPSFLSKHRLGNPGGYKEYFIRVSDSKNKETKGLYKIIYNE